VGGGGTKYQKKKRGSGEGVTYIMLTIELSLRGLPFPQRKGLKTLSDGQWWTGEIGAEKFYQKEGS